MNPFGPFGNMMPYSNFHGMNLDWVIQIAKDFLDQYTGIQQLITDGENALEEKAQELEGLLQEWYNTHSNDIADALAAAIVDFRREAEAVGAEVIASIPEDYTSLTNDVDDLSDDVDDLSDDVSSLQGKALLSANSIISNSSLSSVIATEDLDDLIADNAIYYAASLTDATHQPVSTMSGMLLVIKYSSATASGIMQMYYGNDGKIAFRTLHDIPDPVWTDWVIYDNNLYLSSANTVLSDGTMASVLPSGDLDDLYEHSEIYYCNLSNAEHQAVPQMTGILIVGKYSPANPYGATQIYLGNNGQLAFRNSHGTTDLWVWDSWTVLANNTYLKSSSQILSNSSLLSIIPSGNLNDLWEEQKIYYCSTLTDATNQPVPQMDGMLMIMKYNPGSSVGLMQIFYHNRGEVYFRVSHGDSLSWDYWKLVGNKNNNRTVSIFKKVVCCGDSYTSGYIVDTESNVNRYNPEYSWPHFMEQITGATYVNAGASGTNTLQWQTNIRGLYKAQQAGKAQAYIVSLMINDASSDEARHLDVGVIADIGTTNQTYYAQYSKIIRELATISPKAFIFVTTIPNDDLDTYGAYNQAVRDIYNAYKDTYNIHLIDLYAYRGLYYISSILLDARSGHYTSVGYQQFAEILAFILSDYIDQHVRDFIDVNITPYDPEPTLPAIEALIQTGSATTIGTSSSAYFTSSGSYIEIDNYIYFRGTIHVLQNVGSALNNTFQGLPTPADTNNSFNQINIDQSISPNYMHWNTSNSNWRLEGAQSTGNVFMIYGKYLKAT